VNFGNFGIDLATLTGSLETKLREARVAGFSQVMLWGKDLAEYPSGYEAALDLIEQSGLRVTGMQVVRDYEGQTGTQHDYKIDLVKAHLSLCKAVGAPLLIVCSATNQLPDDGVQTLERDLRKLANLAVPMGVRIGYKAVPWGRFARSVQDAWDLVEAINHANFSIVLDTFHFLADRSPVELIDDIDPDKIALVQIADFSAFEFHSRTELRDRAIHMRVFPGQGVHNARLAEILHRIDRQGYRGDFSFLVFNDDYHQLPPRFVLKQARRSVQWVTDQVLRRSLPLRVSGWEKKCKLF
jgi:sugar phosphate isomerase/epimerase